MKTLLTIFITFFILTTSYAQGLETLGAGVINFLLTNPKTANQTNATEAAALKTIGTLLSISANRKHEMNVANAGRSELTINTPSGNQATMYADNQGNLYLLYNGTIYPVSAALVNQAKNEVSELKIENSTLPDYNTEELEYKFNQSYCSIIPSKSYTNYVVSKGGEYLNNIAIKNGVPPENIYINPNSTPNKQQYVWVLKRKHKKK